MKPRQLLQAMRRARHQSFAAVSTHCKTSATILLLLTRRRNEQGSYLSMALLVFCFTALPTITSSSL